MQAIEINKITKIYKKGFRAIKVPAVVDLSFTIDKNRIVGFVGPNGAGKTTTIKMIMGLVFATSGQIIINGRDNRENISRQGVAYLSEQPYFYRHLSVIETLQFSGKIIGLIGQRLTDSIIDVLKTVELSGREKTKVRELSKGLQQRLNMACALLGDPHTLIFDEPMSGMDPPGRRLFRTILSNLANQGKTVFFSTHILDDIESICEDVIVLSNGKLSYSGKVSDLLEKGFLGTEFVVAELSDQQSSDLNAMQFTIDKDKHGVHIFVSAEQNQRHCQQWLSERKIDLISMQRRVKPLESLLYGKE
jgi:ABC-2 type transport system ATP-binding protein